MGLLRKTLPLLLPWIYLAFITWGKEVSGRVGLNERETNTETEKDRKGKRERARGNIHCLVALFSWLLCEIILGFSSASS